MVKLLTLCLVGRQHDDDHNNQADNQKFAKGERHQLLTFSHVGCHAHVGTDNPRLPNIEQAEQIR